jgi:hypothetical protein
MFIVMNKHKGGVLIFSGIKRRNTILKIILCLLVENAAVKGWRVFYCNF